MKVLILAGGLGTRLGEETSLKPKPMVEIGNMPILWHVMKIYSSYGFNDFIIMLGYKGEAIKWYFRNYFTNNSDFTIDLTKNEITVHKVNTEPWKVTLCDTGLNTMTGGRIAKVRDYVGDERFMLTYGDGVADIDINALLECHEKSGKLATLTAVNPTERFGVLDVLEDGTVRSFREKPETTQSWINGGFFVCEPGVFDYIEDSPMAVWEREPLMNLAKDNKLNAYKHRGFWRPMDMLRDKIELNNLWNSGEAPWKIWDK